MNQFFYLSRKIKNITNDIATAKIFPPKSLTSKLLTGIMICANSKNIAIKKNKL